jgi:hypothetical protein
VSAWGKAWGNSWGDAWGAVEVEPALVEAGSVASVAAVGTPTASSTVQAAVTGVASVAAVGTPAAASVVQAAVTGVGSRAAVGLPAFTDVGGRLADNGTGGPDPDEDESPGPHRAPRRIRPSQEVPAAVPVVRVAPVVEQLPLEPVLDTTALAAARQSVEAAEGAARAAMQAAEASATRTRLLRLVLLVDALDD